jgi:tetraacyldisaccharide 4'-kinase
MPKSPDFWKNRGLKSTILIPISKIYQRISNIRRKLTKPYKASIPVICVGNATLGGAGKTPFVILLVEVLKHYGKNPCIISRGYKGELKQNILVNSQHSAKEVGDEPLLLAKYAPCIIGKNRRKSAQMASDMGADVIIMDDGLQNPSLAKNLCFLMIDGGYGFGNNRVFPAGSLREPLPNALAKVQASVLVGKDECAILHQLPKQLPLIRAQMIITADTQKVVAFCGIARPQKFYDSLQQANFNIAQTFDFADHHHFTETELQKIKQAALSQNCIIVTTEKDYVRLSPEWQQQITTIPAKMLINNNEILLELLYRHHIIDKG